MYNELDPFKAKFSCRDFMKGLVLGFIYGMGVSKFALIMQLETSDAQNLAKALFEMYPGIKSYQSQLMK